jgi:hypothetical protein
MAGFFGEAPRRGCLGKKLQRTKPFYGHRAAYYASGKQSKPTEGPLTDALPTDLASRPNDRNGTDELSSKILRSAAKNGQN